MHILTSKNSRENDGAEAFGYTPENCRWVAVADDDYKGIAPGQSQVVLFRLLGGLLNQNKYLPIRYMPITIDD